MMTFLFGLGLMFGCFIGAALLALALCVANGRDNEDEEAKA